MYQKGHTNDVIVKHIVLIQHIVASAHVAMIRSEHNDGIFPLSQAFQLLNNAANGII